MQLVTKEIDELIIEYVQDVHNLKSFLGLSGQLILANICHLVEIYVEHEKVVMKPETKIDSSLLKGFDRLMLEMRTSGLGTAQLSQIVQTYRFIYEHKVNQQNS